VLLKAGEDNELKWSRTRKYCSGWKNKKCTRTVVQ